MTPEVGEDIRTLLYDQGAGQGNGIGFIDGLWDCEAERDNIWVYSEPGQGTTFKIYLPQVDEPLGETREEMVGEGLQGNETILIVEDEEVVRKLAVRVLEGQGYKVLEAQDGGKAFMLCEEFKDPIHLILTDVVMPGMSGHRWRIVSKRFMQR